MMARSSIYLWVIVLLSGGVALGQRAEIEPNDSKAEATLIPNLASGETFTGFQLSGTADGSVDYFRVQTAPAPLGIYWHRLRTFTPHPSGVGTGEHFPFILGQRFESGVVLPTVEDIAQSGVRPGERFNDYYAFGMGESVYLKITHNPLAGEIGGYEVTLTTHQITPVDIGVFVPGSITIDTRERARNFGGGQHNTDLWIYDSQLNAIPGYGNDTSTDGAPFNSGAKLTRDYSPGTYFMALSAYDLINDQVNPPDDPSSAVGRVLDFPDAVLSSYSTSGSQAGSDLDFGVTDGLGTREFTAVKPDSVYGVYWAQFRVAVSGDFNNDGVYDCSDVNALTTAVATGGPVASFDLNGDGQLSLVDVDFWRAEAGEFNLGSGRVYRVGDANLDGAVDGSDFGSWNGHKFTNNTFWCDGNFNADLVIDGADFGLWNTNKFISADGTTAVPEPSVVSCLICALACIRLLPQWRSVDQSMDHPS
jgi:hypothetical protein